MAWGKSCPFCYVMENITSGAWFEYRPVTNWDVVGDIVNPPLTQPMLSRFRSRRWRTWSQNGCVTIGRRRSLGTWQFILRRRFCRGPASSSPFWPPSQIQLGCRFACRRSSTRPGKLPLLKWAASVCFSPGGMIRPCCSLWRGGEQQRQRWHSRGNASLSPSIPRRRCHVETVQLHTPHQPRPAHPLPASHVCRPPERKEKRSSLRLFC